MTLKEVIVRITHGSRHIQDRKSRCRNNKNDTCIKVLVLGSLFKLSEAQLRENKEERLDENNTLNRDVFEVEEDYQRTEKGIEGEIERPDSLLSNFPHASKIQGQEETDHQEHSKKVEPLSKEIVGGVINETEESH